MSEDAHASDNLPEQLAQPLSSEFTEDDLIWLAMIHVKDQELT